MRILQIQTSRQPGGLDIKGLLGNAEYEQLRGQLLDLRVFSRGMLTEPASVVKTGAKHSLAKYLLFPVTLRRQFKADRFDFGQIRCGAIRHRETIYVIYEIPSRGLSPEKESEGKCGRPTGRNRSSSHTAGNRPDSNWSDMRSTRFSL